jgi:hypothetical protein
VGTEFLRTTDHVLPMRVLLRNGGVVVAYDAEWFHGNSVLDTAEQDEVLWFIADAAQEALLERYSAIWPVCPTHDVPMWARGVDGATLWVCDRDGGHVIARIGELAAGDATFSPGSFLDDPSA